MNTLFPTLRNGRKSNSTGYRTFPTLSSWIDDMMNDTFETGLNSNFNRGITLPAVNLIKKDHAFEVEMAIPGFKKSDFKIDIDKDLLSISSETETESEEDTDTYTRREFGYSSFKRSFHLPETIDKEKISASYSDGILKVTLPKREEAIDRGVTQIEVS